MATKLDVYKQAELHIGKSTITALTNDVEARYKFDQAWTGVVEEAFMEGDWNFAKKTSSLSASGDTPIAGWGYTFAFPDDYLRTVSVGPYAAWRGSYYDFVDQGGFIYANTDSLSLIYISNEKANQVETWPVMFWRMVAMKLAYETCEALTNGSTKQEDLEGRLKVAVRKAKNIDARNEGNQRIGPGSWLRSRGGWGSGHGSVYVTGGAEIVPEEGDV